jgi:hypothetical protein
MDDGMSGLARMESEERGQEKRGAFRRDGEMGGRDARGPQSALSSVAVAKEEIRPPSRGFRLRLAYGGQDGGQAIRNLVTARS